MLGADTKAVGQRWVHDDEFHTAGCSSGRFIFFSIVRSCSRVRKTGDGWELFSNGLSHLVEVVGRWP